MKKILMGVLGLTLMFTVASKLTAGEDQKPPKAKIEEVTKNMTADQKKQFDQLQAAIKDAAKTYKESKTDENAQKLKDAIKARIEFVAKISGHEPANVDEMVDKQFKRITESGAQGGKKSEKSDKKQ